MQPNPYSSPQGAPPPWSHAPIPPGSPYQSPASAGTLALAAMGGVAALLVFSRLLDITMLVFPASSKLILAVEKITNPLLGLMRLGAIVGFLMWVHRTAKNVVVLGLPGLNSTPGLCVGWFFVPIANLFMPCVVVTQIARASNKKQQASFAVVNWWAAWLLTSILGVVRRMQPTIETREDFIRIEMLDSFQTVCLIIAFVILLFVIPRIGHEQDERFSELQNASPAR